MTTIRVFKLREMVTLTLLVLPSTQLFTLEMLSLTQLRCGKTAKSTIKCSPLESQLPPSQALSTPSLGSSGDSSPPSNQTLTCTRKSHKLSPMKTQSMLGLALENGGVYYS